jgi:hypothetical protein
VKQTLLVLPLVLVAACGGGEAKARGSDEAAAKAAYLKKTEPICAAANAAKKALVAPTGVNDLVPYAKKVVDLSEKVTAEVAAVTPPEADKKDIQAKVVGPLQAEVAGGRDFIKKLEAAKAAGDLTAISNLLADPPTKTRAELTFMKDYGFVDCVVAADTDG